MPKVETYGDKRVQTHIHKQAKMQPTRMARPVDTGSAISKGLSDFGKGLEIGLDNMSPPEEEDALTGFQRAKNDLFFNKDNGYFNSQGKNAYDGAAGANASLDELQKQYANKLTGAARNKFMRASGSVITSGRNSIQQHASNGYQQWDNAVVKDGIDNALENGAFYSPSAIISLDDKNNYQHDLSSFGLKWYNLR